jgi:hypothetical protein
MKSITLVLPHTSAPFFEGLVGRLSRLPLVSGVVIVAPDGASPDPKRGLRVFSGSLTEEGTLNAILGVVETTHVLFVLTGCDLWIDAAGVERLMAEALVDDVGMVYADFSEQAGTGRALHPVNDYQLGSVREDFDFGPVILCSADAVRQSLRRHGALRGSRFAALYDLRLKLSIDFAIRHMTEPLSLVEGGGTPLKGERLFAYVDPLNAQAQKEMEQVFTEHLKRTGAFLPASGLKGSREGAQHPVEASVIIPVKNRKGTIGDAVGSAVAQVTDFPFNVIVVDNHSTDGTTDVLADLAATNNHLIHLIPEKKDLAIGGCWNEGIDAQACGRYAVQLDSDDLYADGGALQKIVDMFRSGDYGMVIGAYTLVDGDLNEIPPGIVDHREWTDENGHNNALRVNGLGAPRAFNTSLLRRIRFPNVSYGEDYSVALRICREYRLGRIFESLYLCRRWVGNTDASLTIEEANRNDAFKDLIRTEELIARQKKNSGGRT